MNPTLAHILELVATLIVGVFGGSFAVAVLNRRKTEAEAEKVHVEAESVIVGGHLETADRLLEFNRDLLKRVEKLEEMVEAGDRREQALESRVAELAGAITRLEAENQSLRARCKKLEGENAELREEVGAN
jgi:predicted RNase H-like nuclease (RuvC/YqgF family)